LVDIDDVYLDRQQRPATRSTACAIVRAPASDNLTSEVEALLSALPEEICGQLRDIRGIRPRLAATAGCDRSAASRRATQLHLRLLDGYLDQLVDLDGSAERQGHEGKYGQAQHQAVHHERGERPGADQLQNPQTAM
jgi:hypothetical protein